MRYAVLTILILLAACATLPEKIQHNIDTRDFNSARILLEEEGVGENITQDADEESLTARYVYEKGVSDHYVKAITTEMHQGNLRRAYYYSVEGLSYCPWSTVLKAKTQELSTKVATLNKIEDELRSIEKDGLSLAESYDVIKELHPEYSILQDSHYLLKTYDKATEIILNEWADRLQYIDYSGSAHELDDFFAFLSHAPNIKGRGNAIQHAVSNYILLAKSAQKQPGSSLNLNNESYTALNDLISYLKNEDEKLLRGCQESLEVLFVEWTNLVIVPQLHNKNVSFEFLCLAERLGNNLKKLQTKQYTSALAVAHLNRAAIRASDGKSAVLALLHIQRATYLNPKGVKGKGDKLLQVADASLNSTKPITASIGIGGNPSISPILYELMRNSIATRINFKTKKYFRWEWKNPDVSDCLVKIYLTDVQAYFPSMYDLSTINSKYLSHYQDVPNPLKEQLASRLQWADSAVDTAKWNYDSAVSSHNIYPTQYSLNNVNNAYNRYSMAVDNYNSILNQYKMTPSTISEPVYLPYSYRAGNIKSGWSMAANITAGDASYTFHDEDIDTDFVRIGTKLQDVNPNSRRDDGVNIDTSNERMIQKHDIMVEKLVGRLQAAVCAIEFDTFPRTEKGEKELLAALYQPFGVYNLKNSEEWVLASIENFSLPSTKATPAPMTLKRHPTSRHDSLKSLVSLYETVVCELKDELGHGTGTLISSDGLILTCAHVLTGGSVSSVFHSGEHRGQYPCDIVFVDEKNDVALVKARGLNVSMWANVRLGNFSEKGEKIVAIGNPALDGSTTNVAGATQGIVSNPDIQTHNTHRMVSDITIASGSSGGPIFSLETGEVIGVVTAVGSAGFAGEGNVSSSGYFCLSAPSLYLKNWLGLRY